MQPNRAKAERTAPEDGRPAGNVFDKYASPNPLHRLLMRRFLASAEAMIRRRSPEIRSILEVGCGEGYLAAAIATLGIAPVRASDRSAEIIALARTLHGKHGIEFSVQEIADLDPDADGADLVVACEVLEHLADPATALARLAQTSRRFLLLSVPREPWWRVLNVLRGAYLAAGGNTPGHLQHWGRRRFISFVGEYMDILDVATPLPWVMVLGRRRQSTR